MHGKNESDSQVVGHSVRHAKIETRDNITMTGSLSQLNGGYASVDSTAFREKAILRSYIMLYLGVGNFKSTL